MEGIPSQETLHLLFLHWKENSQKEHILLYRGFDVTAILSGNVLDALDSVAVAGLIRFGGGDCSVCQDWITIKIIGFLNDNAAAGTLTVERNNTKLFRHLLHGFNCVVHDISEYGVGLHRCQEGKQGAVNHGAELDSLICTDEILFGQHHIQHVVTGFDPGIINADCVSKLVDFFLVQLVFDAAKDVLEIMAFQTDGVHARFDGFVLGLILLPQLLEDFQLVGLFIL